MLAPPTKAEISSSSPKPHSSGIGRKYIGLHFPFITELEIQKQTKEKQRKTKDAGIDCLNSYSFAI